MTFVFTLLDLSPALRCNIDYLVAFRDASLNNRYKLWKYIFGRFDRFEDFCRVMDVLTQNYGAMVLDSTSATASLEESLFYLDSEKADGPALHVEFDHAPETETTDEPISLCGLTLPSWVSSFRSYLCW